MKNNIIKYSFFNKAIVCICVLFMSTTTIFAQTDLPDEPDDFGAPIDNYVFILAIIGIIYVLFRFKNQLKQTNR